MTATTDTRSPGPPPPPPSGRSPRPGGRSAGARERRSAVYALVGGVALLVVSLLPDAVRAVVAPPLALLVPGYGVVTAALGPSRPRPLVLRLVAYLTVGLAIWALLGTFVALPGLELTQGRVLALVALVAVGSAGAMVLWPTAPPADPDLEHRRPNSIRVFVAFATAVGVSIGVLAVATYVHTSPEQFDAIEFLGIDPIEPLANPGDRPVTLAVTVTNNTAVPRTYELVSGVDGAYEWGTQRFDVAPGASWIGRVTGVVPPSGCLQRIGLDLKPAGGQAIRLTKWVEPTPDLECKRRTTRPAPPGSAPTNATTPAGPGPVGSVPPGSS